MTSLPDRIGAVDVMTLRDADASEFEAELAPLLGEAVRLAMGMLLNAVDAEDAVQDACVRAWRRRVNRHPDTELRPWFLGIVANQCRDAMRGRWWRVVRVADVADATQTAGDDAAGNIDLRQAVSRLPYRRRLVIVLRYYVDPPFDDVAATMGCSVDAAKALVQRATADLERALSIAESVQADIDHADLGARIHAEVDPMLPRAGVEQRVLQAFRERVDGKRRRRFAWSAPFRTTVGGAIVALAVLELVGGALALTLTLRGHPQQTIPAVTPVVPVVPPISPPTGSAAPSPSPTSSTPGAITYVQPGSVSFPSAADGWAAGNACDAQSRCERGIARTTDGGILWSLVGTPVNALEGLTLSIAAASSADAWVWGVDPNGTGLPPILAATHDAGRTWRQVALGGATVVDVQIANGTAWAETACAADATTCAARLLSQPVSGGAWTAIGPVPQAVQGPAFSNGAVSGPWLVRSGTRAWIIDGNEQKPALVSTSDGGRLWKQLPLPCAYGANMSLGASSADELMLACVNEGGWPAPQAVWTSSDGGAVWTLRSRNWYTDFQPPQPNVGHLENQGAPIGLAVITRDIAWMVNDRGDDLVTRDGGVTWSAATLPETYFGNAGGGEAVVFADALHGWTFVTAGMWVTTDGGVVWKRQSIVGPVPGY
ncbi:MAG TPA: sigma-70 family RNA polymerase sigma factor [Candidatus Saccharimonadales bacterium]|nr:sigma-70 family RNA polymerase sigma factor [Candidatus Saccharimonadales bacterium]